MPVAINTLLILNCDGNPHIWVYGVSKRVLTQLGRCMTPLFGCMTPMRELHENHPYLERVISYPRAWPPRLGPRGNHA